MTKRPVLMPARPHDNVLRHMAGDPLLLAASDEALCRYWYQIVRLALKAQRRVR